MNANASMLLALMQATKRVDLTTSDQLIKLPASITARFAPLPEYGVISAAWLLVRRKPIGLALPTYLSVKI